MTNITKYYVPSLFSHNGIEDIINFFTESHSFFRKNECHYPYNVKVLKDGTSILEYSLAGFTKDDITLTIENDKLVVKAEIVNKDDKNEESTRYVYQGIAKRSMVHSVHVDPHYHDLKKITANFENGILVVTIPQSKESKDSKFEVKIN